MGWRGCASAMGVIKLPPSCSNPKLMCQIHFHDWKYINFDFKISLKFVYKGPINNIPLSGPMIVSLLTHICVTRPQWVNTPGPKTKFSLFRRRFSTQYIKDNCISWTGYNSWYVSLGLINGGEAHKQQVNIKANYFPLRCLYTYMHMLIIFLDVLFYSGLLIASMRH